MGFRKPDFKKANILANEILAASNTLVTFPVNTKKIVKEWSDIVIHTFNMAHESGIDIEAFGSESAVLQCKEGRYMIFYNQDEHASRVKYSILHEFGHYLFGHPLKRYENEDEYGFYEVEANCFAAQLLMPEQVLRELRKRGARITKEFLMQHFGVSEEAALRRIETMGKCNYEWRSKEESIFDETILFKYKEFIDAILPEKGINNWYADEFDRQRERDSWVYDSRTRYRD